MIGLRARISYVFFTLICFTSIQSWGWGKEGHTTIEVAAARLMPPSSFSRFLKANAAELKYMSMTPDFQWKHGSVEHPEEAATHFFHADFYLNSGGISKDIKELMSQHGKKNVVDNGTVPWRIQQLSLLLYKHLKARNPERVLQIASVLGHYVGDAGNPLHVTSDYDGASVGLKGLHSYFESQSVRLIPPAELMEKVLAAGEALMGKLPEDIDPMDAALWLVKVGYSKTPSVIKLGKATGLNAEFSRRARPLIVQTMAPSAVVLAKIWNAAWVAAGKPVLPSASLGEVPDPAWIPPYYLQ